MSSTNNIPNNLNDEINIEQDEFNIKIIRRTLENNTHEVLEDTKIKRITSWRKSKRKFFQSLIFNLLSLGIIHIISLFYPSLYIKLYCNQRKPKECDFFLVEDIYGYLTLCKKIYKKDKTPSGINFSSDNTKEAIMSSSMSHYNDNNLRKYLTKNLTYSFVYKGVTYEYDENKNEIIAVYLNLLNFTCKDIFHYFSDGLSSENLVKIFLNRYGKNEYILNFRMIYLYLLRVELPYIIFVLIVGVVELCLYDYISFFAKLIIIFIVIAAVLINLKINIYDKYVNEYTLDGDKNEVRVKRNQKSDIFCIIKNSELLPGDLIFLKSNDIVPCDCLILEGECMANSNNLTGNLNIFRKISLENNGSSFNYKFNKDNILYHGMKIVKTYSNLQKGYISALCVNTGPNTYKANMYSNALYIFERKKEYSSTYDFFGEGRKSFIFIIITVFTASVFIIRDNPSKYIDLSNKDTRKLFLIIVLRILCKSLMPMYYLINNLILLISSWDLQNKNIYTFDKSKLLSSSNIDTIFLSKTGTLCEDKFEINGYHPIAVNNHSFNNLGFRTYSTMQNKEMNLQLVKYYKDYLDQKNEVDYNNIKQDNKTDNNNNKNNVEKINKKCYEYSTLFLECLLSCNNLEKYGMEVFGNSIDAEIFKAMKWDIKADNSDNNMINSDIEIISENTSNIPKMNIYDKAKNDIFPNNYYKITESLKSEDNVQKIKSSQNDLLNPNKIRKSIKNTEWNYRDSLISTNNNNIEQDISQSHINSYKLRIYKRFIKEGAFSSSSITYNFITKELRFNTKGIPEDILDKCNPASIPESFYKIISFYRRKGFIVIVCAGKKLLMEQYNDYFTEDKYMFDLTFYGFITLKNKLKYEVNYVLDDLKQFNCNYVMITGDDIYNTLPVGFESTILENKDIYSFDKDEIKNRIIIKKVYDSKSEYKRNVENEIIQGNEVINEKFSKFNISKFIDKTLKGQLSKSKISKAFESSETNINKYLKSDKKIQPLNLDGEGNNDNTKGKENGELEQGQKTRNLKKGYENSGIATSKDLLFTVDENNVSSKDIRKKIKLSRKNINSIKESSFFKSPRNTFNTFNSRKTANSKFFANPENMQLLNLEIFAKPLYYYQDIFEEHKELDEDDCVYCISGSVFEFLYQNKTKKHAKIFLDKIHKRCKIFYNMTSISKSKVIDYYREFPNNCICTIGECQSDIDPIITSNIGINLQAPRNINTILSHFYSRDGNLLIIKNIIRGGRAIKENHMLMKISCSIYTLMINSYIICCFLREMDVIQGQLNLMEIAYLILSISAFTASTENDESSNCLIQKKKLFIFHYVVQIIGLIFIKALGVYFHATVFNKNDFIETKSIDKIYSTYYFIFCVEQLFSTIFVLNLNCFYRKNWFFNTTFIIILSIILFYFFTIITLNDSNYKFDIFGICYFEFFENIVDAYDENNKLNIFLICLIDFGLSIIYSRIVNFIFDKLSNNTSICNK